MPRWERYDKGYYTDKYYLYVPLFLFTYILEVRAFFTMRNRTVILCIVARAVVTISGVTTITFLSCMREETSMSAPRKRKTEAKTETVPPSELTASYLDVVETAKLAQCSVHPGANDIVVVQDGNQQNKRTFEKTLQGFGQAILWMSALAPVTDTIRSITETALFYMLSSLPLQITIEQKPQSELYLWHVLDQEGEAGSFLAAMKQALTSLMRQYLTLTEQENVNP